MVISDGVIKQVIIHVGLSPLTEDARVLLQVEGARARGDGVGGALSHLARAHSLQAAEPDVRLCWLGVQNLRETTRT